MQSCGGGRLAKNKNYAYAGSAWTSSKQVAVRTGPEQCEHQAVFFDAVYQQPVEHYVTFAKARIFAGQFMVAVL